MKPTVVQAHVWRFHGIRGACRLILPLILLGTTTLAPKLSAKVSRATILGQASRYGEQHRGMRMANGHRFDPNKLTAASWFYPLGTRLRVTLFSSPTGKGTRSARAVIVTVTDRGPAEELVHSGRIIDLSQAAFRKLATPDAGLIYVTVRPEQDS